VKKQGKHYTAVRWGENLISPVAIDVPQKSEIQVQNVEP
jgi:hypothetical protein